jgi:hypothetical protein
MLQVTAVHDDDALKLGQGAKLKAVSATRMMKSQGLDIEEAAGSSKLIWWRVETSRDKGRGDSNIYISRLTISSLGLLDPWSVGRTHKRSGTLRSSACFSRASRR